VRRLVQSVLTGLVLAAAIVPAAATAATAVKTVRYGRYALRVPAGWPVFRLAYDPSACVRFDRHAVYLGTPSAAQRCPAHAVGRTEAVLVEPLSAVAGRRGSGRHGTRALPAAGGGALAGGSIGRLMLPGRGVVVTATWARDPRLIERVLSLRSLPARPATARPAAVLAPGVRAAATAPGVTTTAPHGVVHLTRHALDVGGYGFDACAAPSPAAMSAWLGSSPFRAAAIYIGGANSACAQPNLSASWVSTESAAGWQLIPVYVGLQSPSSSCGCATIAPAQAQSQGVAAAIDAVAQAQALGIGPGNPIYDDMEAYNPKTSSTAAVLSFLSAWTSELHAYGYVSGVYASGGSGITDLVGVYGTTFVEPDELWIADWNNQATVSDPYVPATDWPNNQRLHQYEGGHVDNYGGFKLDIDSDYLDGATATAGNGTGTVATGALPDGTFVSYHGNTYRLAGGAPLYVHSWTVYGGPQPTLALADSQWQALNPVPANGTFIRMTGTSRVYRIAGGAPVYVPNWSAFGGPQPTVTVDRWDLLNISSPRSHLNAVPADGTVVQGLPSGAYWLFSAGMRAPTAPSSSAVTVADAGLGPFYESPTPSRVILSGIARAKPKLRVTVTAGANAPALKAFVIKLPAGLRFARYAQYVAPGVVTWSLGGTLLPSAIRLSRGTLTVTLQSPARAVRITIFGTALIATQALVAQARAGTGGSLPITLTATDAKQDVAVLALDPPA
jgi:hypothetical protein